MVDATRWLERRMARKTEAPRANGGLTRRAVLVLGGGLMAGDAMAAGASFYDFRLEAIEGGPLDLGGFRGKPVLVVNTASFCGYTPQYAGLQKLHEKYAARGLVVLGVPSQDFNQESSDNKKIKDFCDANYNVEFPMTTVSHVRGAQAAPVFAFLAERGGGPP